MATITPQHPEPAPPARPPAANAQPVKEKLQDQFKRQIEEHEKAYKIADDAAYQKATRGVIDDDMRDRVLALGGDATRSSPDPFQRLDDAVPGLTTTTGAYKVPIDPTTAAVPAPKGWAEHMMGERCYSPTIGSGREGGKGEVHYQEPEKAKAHHE
jgi:hypothetical protein